MGGKRRLRKKPKSTPRLTLLSLAVAPFPPCPGREPVNLRFACFVACLYHPLPSFGVPEPVSLPHFCRRSPVGPESRYNTLPQTARENPSSFFFQAAALSVCL
jgi:hypothetical protein